MRGMLLLIAVVSIFFTSAQSQDRPPRFRGTMAVDLLIVGVGNSLTQREVEVFEA